MQLTNATSSIAGPRKAILKSQDIINQAPEVLDFFTEKRFKPAVMRYGHGNLTDLDRGIPTDITRIYTIAAYDESYPTPGCLKVYAENRMSPVTSVAVKYPDKSFQIFRLDERRLPEIEFFYDVEPLKVGETVVLVGGEDHSDDLIRLKNSSSTLSRKTEHRFDIDNGQVLRNVQISSVYDVVKPDTDDQITIGLILDDPLKTIEVSRGGSIIVTRVQ